MGTEPLQTYSKAQMRLDMFLLKNAYYETQTLASYIDSKATNQLSNFSFFFTFKAIIYLILLKQILKSHKYTYRKYFVYTEFDMPPNTFKPLS